ncbi:MAG: hypothetical protein PHU78_05045 [Heliobacteriaceae bacterium]|nr:hypothetical protein [Heliobacteriaceae bacterium]
MEITQLAFMPDFRLVPVVSRQCPYCQKNQQLTLPSPPARETAPNDPRMLIGKILYPIPAISCCAVTRPATHVKLKFTDDNGTPRETRSYQIGFSEVPVVGHPGVFPITRTWAQQQEFTAQWHRQEALWASSQQAFLSRCRAYFSIHWPQIITEMDLGEFLEVLKVLNMLPQDLPSPTTKVGSGTAGKAKKRYLKLIAKVRDCFIATFPPSKLELLFHAIVSFTVQLLLIPGLYYQKLNVAKLERMLGRTMLSFVLLGFPVVPNLEPIRNRALFNLISPFDTGSRFMAYSRRLKTELAETRNTITRLQKTIARQQDHLTGLGRQLSQANQENRRLQKDRRFPAVTPPSDQAQKIRDLKALNRELRSQIKELQPAPPPPAVLQEVATAGSRLPATSDREVALTTLHGLTVGIFGGVRNNPADPKTYPCRLLCSDARKPEWARMLNRCDVLVILTQHISHTAMWLIKEHAITEEKPVFFSRHIHLPTILQTVATSLSGGKTVYRRKDLLA